MALVLVLVTVLVIVLMLMVVVMMLMIWIWICSAQPLALTEAEQRLMMDQVRVRGQRAKETACRQIRQRMLIFSVACPRLGNGFWWTWWRSLRSLLHCARPGWSKHF